jgi:hypothetical protein
MVYDSLMTRGDIMGTYKNPKPDIARILSRPVHLQGRRRLLLRNVDV